MISCYDCGELFESRKSDGIVQVYDEYNNKWLTSCPSCGGKEFFEEDFDEYDDYDADYEG